MTVYFRLLIAAFCFIFLQGQARICPLPSVVSTGVPPAPWQWNPFSDVRPQGQGALVLLRANILIAGWGRGVLCSYGNKTGIYSVWWPVTVKVPAPIDYRWIDTLGGFECTDSLTICEFYPA